MFNKINSVLVILIFQWKITLQSNLRLTVMVSERMPFVIFPKEHLSRKLGGLDISILDDFGKKYKIQVEYVQTDETISTVQSIEEFLKNSNGSKIDIFAGALEETSVTRKYLIGSRSYYEDSLNWCLLKDPSPVWMNLLEFCHDPTVWICCTLMTLLCLFIAYFGQAFEATKWDWNKMLIIGLTCYLGCSSVYKPKNNSNRIAFIFFLFGSIVFDTVLIGKLIRWNEQINYYPRIKTFEEILMKQYDLIGDQFTLNKLIELNKVKFTQ